MKPAMGPAMEHLTSVSGSFRAKVIAARLGTEGVLAEIRGCVDVYPIFGEVDIYVRSDQLELAREILLADAVDDAFDSVDGNPWDDDEYVGYEPDGRGALRRRRRMAILALLVVVLLVLVSYLSAAVVG